jgi:3-oxoacyl-[acyl-carrier protein] reductase
MELQGKSVLVAGASRPLGRAIARRFAAEGGRLILPVYDWPESIREMEEEFTKAGFDFLLTQTDLRRVEHVAQLAETVGATIDGLDYLINNIERGGMPIVHGSYEHPHNSEQWDLEFTTTVKAKALLFEYFKDLLLASPGGAVLNISSIAAEVGRTGPAAPFFSDGYSAANRAVKSLTRNWARQLAPHVRVNEIALGFIEHRHGPGTRGWEQCSTHQQEQLLDHILLGRIGHCEEVAELVYYLAVAARYMTGACVCLDGGYQLGGEGVPPLPPGIL